MAATIFRYTARTVEGDLVRGAVQAADVDAVLATLQTRALYVTAIERETALSGAVMRTLRIGGVSRKALLAFFRSFATLIRAGLSIRYSLEVTIERCADPALREALRSLAADVEHGSSLSAAMARRPSAFAPLFVAMIAAGETGGILEEVLERLAHFLERDASLRKRLQSALAYPAIVLVAAIALVIFLLLRVVPMFASMFESFHVDLPWSTQFLLNVSHLLRSWPTWAALGACAAVGAFVLVQFARTERGGLLTDRLRFRLPYVGALIRKAIMARLARMLGTLLRSGIELVSAIDAVIPVTGSPVYARALWQVDRALRQGETLSQPLLASGAFDPMFLALTRVGEESGKLDEMLLKVAEYFESDVEAAVATLSAIIEPALMVVLGTIVGFIVFSIFIPLYTLIGSVSK